MPSGITQVLRPYRLSFRFLLGAICLACIQPGLPTGAQSPPSSRSPGQRGRVRSVADSTQYPWSSICKIIATFPDETTIEASGTMIGRHHCLTALHVLYDVRTKTAAKRIRIIPGYDDDRLLTQGLSSHPFGTTHVGQFLFWESPDIAIIVTDTNIGDQSSWMTVGSRSDREMLSQNYVLGGYAGSSRGTERQVMQTVTVSRIEGDRVRFNSDSPAGMEGGPIFVREARGRGGEQDIWTIVGVQTGAGRGSRIPMEMRRLLDRFLRDDFSSVKTHIPIPAREGDIGIRSGRRSP